MSLKTYMQTDTFKLKDNIRCYIFYCIRSNPDRPKISLRVCERRMQYSVGIRSAYCQGIPKKRSKPVHNINSTSKNKR